MKRCLSFLLTLLLIGGILIPALSSQVYADVPTTAGQVATSTGRLNVRSGPSASAGVVSSLDKGSYVTLHDQSGSWWQVEYAPGRYGYCHGNYIRTLSTSPATVRTQSGNLNVRSGAGTGYSRIAGLASGRSVLVLSTSSGWSRILFDGIRVGYVSAAYLETGERYPAITLSVPYFMQTDNRWSGVTLGSSGKTIGQIGCATTAVAMMESHRTGRTIYPDAMSKQLRYDSAGNLYWPSHYTLDTNASVYLSTLYRLLEQGKPVLLGLKNPYGGQHWVVVTGYTGGAALTASSFTIHDPGSSGRKNLGQLLASHPNFYKLFYY